VLPDIEDFARSFLCDNRLAALACQAGEVINSEDIIDLAAEARALHMTLTLYCRGLDKVSECRELWLKAAEFFQAASKVWLNVPCDGELLSYHRALLVHLHEVSVDRVQLYSICAADRLVYRSAKEEKHCVD